MKKITIIAIITVCLFLLLFGISVYAYHELTKQDLRSEVKSDDYGTFKEEEKENSNRIINLLDKSVTAIYKETFNQNNKSVDMRADSFGTYDIYVDNDNNQFIYLYNTSTLCGYKANTIYGDFLEKDKAISEDIVKEKCNVFLINTIPNYNRYKFDNIYYDEREGIYVVEFVSFLNNIKTDDKCIVWVTSTGNIGAYSAFNLERYTIYKELKFNYNEIETKFFEQVNYIDYKLIDKYITLTDEGKLVMAFQIYDNKKSISETIQIELN